MSRLWDGVDDEMRFAPEGIVLNGAWTMGGLIDLTAADGAWQAFISGHSTATVGQCGIGRRSTNYMTAFNPGFLVDNSGGGAAHDILAADGWEWIYARRSTATGAVTFSKSIHGSGTWVHHTDASATTAGASVSGGHIRIGNWEASDFFGGCAAMFAIWDGAALSQAQIESTDNSNGTSDVYALTPDFLADDSNAFATNLMTGTARTAITGTADDANDPSGYTYGIGGAPALPPNLTMAPYQGAF